MSCHLHRVFFSVVVPLLLSTPLIGVMALPAQTTQNTATSSESVPADPAAGSNSMDVPDLIPSLGGQGTRGGSGFASNGFSGGIANPLGGGVRSGFRGGVAGSDNPAGFLGPGASFNQMMRGGLSLPMNSSFGNFRFSYQSPFSLTNNLQMNALNGYGSGFATYESPHARSGRIDFSASAKVGMGAVNGMSNYGGDWTNQGGAGIHGPSGHGANEQPSTAVSFRLKF
jgi:hypothetical protein